MKKPLLNPECCEALGQTLKEGEASGRAENLIEELDRESFDLVADKTKRENTGHSQADIDNAVDEALRWARR